MNKENDKKQITIRIDSELHKKLKITAVAKDVSINEYVFYFFDEFKYFAQ